MEKKEESTSKESVGRFLCRGTELKKKKKKKKKKEREKRRNKRKRRISEGKPFFCSNVKCVSDFLLFLPTISFEEVKNQRSILGRGNRVE